MSNTLRDYGANTGAETSAVAAPSMSGNFLSALGSDVADIGRGLLDVAAIPGRVWRGEFAPGSPEMSDAARQFALSWGITAAPVGIATVPANALGTIRGYHGTPHTFESEPGAPFGQFRNEAIGSGEGAQSYGYGHYIAGNPKVAETYQKNLSKSQ